MTGVRAALLCGGRGERLGPLTTRVCKPLVPYAGSCRLVDFSLANAARSGIDDVVLLSQHGERALIDHILEHWDRRQDFRLHFGPQEEAVREAAVDGRLPEDFSLRPRTAELGTADALIANGEWLFDGDLRDVLVLHADHVYLFDYRPMIRVHRESGADATIGVQRIERRFVRLFGMVDVGPSGEVRRLVEKPDEPTSDLIFTAFCLFEVSALRDVLEQLDQLGASGWQHDISRDVLPFMIANGFTVRAYEANDYWADIGTVERYLLGHLALVQPDSVMDRNEIPATLPGANVMRFTEVGVLASAPVTRNARVTDSVIYPGCVIEPGSCVERSVVLPNARVTRGSRVCDSIVLTGETIAGERKGIADGFARQRLRAGPPMLATHQVEA